jgi:predicted nucleic acid-binding protein
MIAFFDTGVHIAVIKRRVSLARVIEEAGGGPVRLSPIVASELLRGGTPATRSEVTEMVARLRPIEPPSWRRCWIEAGSLLPRIFPDHEEVGLSRLQNDTLLALTARYTGTLLVTTDQHFEAIRRYVPFALNLLAP